MPTVPADSTDLAAMLAWQVAAGADEAMEAVPVDRYKSSAVAKSPALANPTPWPIPLGAFPPRRRQHPRG